MLCVFANKQDIEGAMTVTEVANALGLSAIKNRKYQIFKTSAIKGDGLDEAMEWWASCYFLLLLIMLLVKWYDDGISELHQDVAEVQLAIVIACRCILFNRPLQYNIGLLS